MAELSDADWDFLNRLYGEADLLLSDRRPWLIDIKVNHRAVGWHFLNDPTSHQQFALSLHDKLRHDRNDRALELHVRKVMLDFACEANDRAQCEAILAKLAEPIEAPAAPIDPTSSTAGSVPLDALRDGFLSPDAIRGEEALHEIIGRGPAVVLSVLHWLQSAPPKSSATHDLLRLHRVRTLCARYPETSGPLLLRLVRGDDGPVWSSAASCFDYFTDPDVKQSLANEVGAYITAALKSVVVEAVEPVRQAILALGYLGAWDWRHKVTEVLAASATDPDGKSVNWALSAVGLLLAKQPPDQTGFASYLSFVVEGFQSRKFGQKPPDDRSWEQAVDRAICRRKAVVGADEVLACIRHGLDSFNGDRSIETMRIIGSAARLLGELNLTAAIAPLHSLFADPRLPADLRARCARAASRIRSARTASTFLTPPQGQDDPPYWAGYPAMRNAQYTPDPEATLRHAFARMNVTKVERSPVARAIGLSQAHEFTPWLKDAVHHSDGIVRGTARLALARLTGSATRAVLEEAIQVVTSDQERLLTNLALVQTGGNPSSDLLNATMSASLFDGKTSADVVEDVVTVLSNAAPEYERLLIPWGVIIRTEPANLLGSW